MSVYVFELCMVSIMASACPVYNSQESSLRKLPHLLASKIVATSKRIRVKFEPCCSSNLIAFVVQTELSVLATIPTGPCLTSGHMKQNLSCCILCQ